MVEASIPTLEFQRTARIARRMQAIEAFQVMEVLARARRLEDEGRDIVHMEIGEPDFLSPPEVIEAGQRALREGHMHYTPASGLSALREAIAQFYERRYAVRVSPQRIIVTPGSSAALQLVMGVLVNPGDRVLLSDPGYPCNRHFVRIFEGRPIGVPVGADSTYQLTAELLEEYWQDPVAAVLAASPANPSGTVLGEAEMRALIAAVARGGARLVVDEIYHGLEYGRKWVNTALAYADDLFVVNSFSKYFGMTGWRLGWLVAPEGYVRELEKLAQNLFIAAPTLSQHAALAAFSPATLEILEERRRAFQARRDFLLPHLRRLGFEILAEPQGAFYLYAGSGRFSRDSHQLALQLLEQAGVAITPGQDFGTYQAQQHVRFAYTTSVDRLQEGVSRLEEFLGTRG